MDKTLMGVRDARRLGAVEAAVQGTKSNRAAAQAVKLSLRQFKRLRRRYQARGPAGLIHGNRGRISRRRLAPAIRERIMTLLQQPAVRLNDCHIRDLVQEEGHSVSAETVRQIRRTLGLVPKNRRRPARHHRRRERQARAGAMVLIDGSPFPWFGREQPPYSLVGTQDDATGVPLSGCFRLEEDLHGFTVALRDLILTEGVPDVMYGDRTGIAVRNDHHWTHDEELAGRQDPTQFGHMLEELGIRYIGAHSPEAKGRIERQWRTFQDRLTAEFALRGIQTPAAAEAFLPGFFARCRGWFGQAPRETDAAWRPAPPDLDRILACRYRRSVARDNTVTLGDRVVQIPPGPYHRSYARCQVEVRELLDGRALVFHEDRVIAQQPAPPAFILVPRRVARAVRRARPENDALGSPRIDSEIPARVQSRPPKTSRDQLTTAHRPKATHPWKRSYKPNLPPSPVGA